MNEWKVENSIRAFVHDSIHPDHPKIFISVGWVQTEEQLSSLLVKFMDDPNKGRLFGYSCSEFIPWASGGLYWYEDLVKAIYEGPKEFTAHIWKMIDYYNLESLYDLTFKNVEWTRMAHTSNDSICGGSANFNYKEVIRNVNYIPMKCQIPKTIEWPSSRYARLIPEYMKEVNEQ